MAGKFIVFEGLDTSGKTYQAKLLKQNLESEYGKEVVILTREPGSEYVEMAQDIRNILLHTDYDICSDAEMFLYAADRAQHIHILNKFLEQDKIIICDRYFYSSIVYQGYAGNSGTDKIIQVSRLATNGLIPDIMFVMNISIEEYYRRNKERETLDRIEQKGEAYFARCVSGYQKLPEFFDGPNRDMFPDKAFLIDAEHSKEENQERILKLTLEMLNK